MANITLADSGRSLDSFAFPLLVSYDAIRSASTLVPAFWAFCHIYHRLAPSWTTTRQHAWILTTVSSALMTLVSIPLFADYVSSGGDVKSVRALPLLTYTTCRIFQAYLLADLTMGFMYYRSEVNLLTGWIHHLLYVIIVHYTIQRGWANVFCLCALMELPTFILGISFLYPRLRSNIAFAVAFFMTRIAFHVVMFISYLIPTNRASVTGGSYLPSAILAGIFPMHVMWFKACVQGFIRRNKAAGAAGEVQVARVVTVDTVLTQSRQNTRFCYTLRATGTQVVIPGSLKRVGRRVSHHTWPARKRVYDFVGLSPRRPPIPSRGDF